MARLSSIDVLPEAVQAEIGRLRRNGRTIDEILAHLRTLDGIAPPSRSALGRHIQDVDTMFAQIRASRQAALVLTSGTDDVPDSALARANIEMVHAAVMELQMAALSGEKLDVGAVKTLAQSLDSLGRATKANVDVLLAAERRAGDRARREALAQAADQAAQSASEAGLSADRAAQLRRDVLGLRPVAT